MCSTRLDKFQLQDKKSIVQVAEWNAGERKLRLIYALSPLWKTADAEVKEYLYIRDENPTLKSISF